MGGLDIAFLIKLATFIATHTGQPEMEVIQDILTTAQRIGQAQGAYIGPGFSPDALYPLTSTWLTPDLQAQWAKRQHEQVVGLAQEVMNVATGATASLPEVARLLGEFYARNNDPMGGAELAQTGNGINALGVQVNTGVLSVLSELAQLETDKAARESFAISQAKDQADAYHNVASIAGGVEFEPVAVDPFSGNIR